MANAFDQFDAAAPVAAGNPFDAFDASASAPPLAIKVKPREEDPVRAQVRKELDAQYKAGMPKQGFGRQVLQGATLNSADEILAAMNVPFQMMKRGTFDPTEAYGYAKAREDLMQEDARKDAPIASGAGEMLGGVLSGGGLYRAGATLAPAIAGRLGGGLLGTAVGGAADGAAYGAIAGAADENGSRRLQGGLTGAAAGAGFGAGVPLATAGLGMAAAPVLSNISARMNPGRYADRQLLQAATESGQTPAQVADRVALAAADGQGEYRLVDALDNAGRRKAAVVAKNPGEGRQQMVEFFDQRQAGQGGRVAQALEEGLGAPETAQAASLRLRAARRAADNAAFPNVRADAGAVNVTPVIDTIDRTLAPGMMGDLGLDAGLRPDSVEATLGRARSLLTNDRSQATGFERLQRVRGDISDATDAAFAGNQGNKARLLTEVRNALDTQLQAASSGYRDAMAQSARNARVVDAVDAGTAAAGRGRTEDKIRAFGTLAPAEQGAFRTGYADPLITRAQRSAMNADASRPLTSLAARTELPAFAAPGQGEPMMRRLGREGEMFRARAAATGGSTTAENLADNAAGGLDPAILGRLLSGDIFGAARNALHRTSAGITGNTEAVRARLAERLLNGNPDEIRALLTQLADQAGQRSDRGAFALRSFLGGTLPFVTGPSSSRPIGG